MRTLFSLRRHVQLTGLVLLTVIALCSYSQNSEESHSKVSGKSNINEKNPGLEKDLLVLGTDSGIAVTPICIIVVDSASRKNLIAWERMSDTNISGYNVYKQSPLGTYDKIGNVPYDSISEFVDMDSDPKVKSNKYKISTVNMGGDESILSDHHQTIYLSVYPEGSENMLDWTHYEGFSFGYYKIYRGPSPDSMSILDSVLSNENFYFDFTPPSGLVYYQVSIVKDDACYPRIIRGITSGGPYSQSLSNLRDYSNSPMDYLATSASSLNFDFSGGSLFVDVYTSLSTWNVNSDQSWLKVESDTINNLISITADPSSGSQERSATITVSGDSVANYTISVSQTGKPVSVSEFVNQENIIVYPNPFKDYIIINVIDSKDKIQRIKVYDFSGKNVISLTDIDESFFSVPVQNLISGLYIVEVVAGKTITNKLILKN